MGLYAQLASSPRDDEKKPMQVAAPSAHAGIQAALRGSYALAPIDKEFVRLLARLR